MGTLAQANTIGSSDVWYQALFYLHILTAIVGLGAVFLNGLYGAQAEKRGGPEGLAVSEANLFVSDIAQYVIYAIFVTGLLMGITADEPVGLGDAWLSISMLLFIIAIGISHGVLKPTVKKMQATMQTMIDAGPSEAGPPPGAAEMQAMGKRVGAAGASLNLIVLVILYLMIWKPGLI